MKRMEPYLFIITAVVIFSGMASAQQGPEGQAPRTGVKKLTFGIYAPNTAFASNSQRWSYIKRLSSYVSSVTGIRCEGRAYSRAGAFSSALGKLDFAVVDPVYLTLHRGRFRVLAVATYGGGTRAPWALFAKTASSFQDLRGKVLVMARAAGSEVSFAEGLLYGEIDVRKYFKSIKVVPDLAAAVSSVRLGRGDAVFAPVQMGAGLTRIISVGTVPNAAFVLVNRSLPADLIRRVTGAARSVGDPALGSFGGSSFSGVRLGRAKATFELRRPKLLRFGFKNFLKPIEGQYEKSDMEEEFWLQ